MKRLKSLCAFSWLCFIVSSYIYPLATALPSDDDDTTPQALSDELLKANNATSARKTNKTIAKKCGTKGPKKKNTKKKAKQIQAAAVSNDTKAQIASALASNTTVSRSSVNLTQTFRFVRKYQLQISVLMAVVAFRRELSHILRHVGWHLLTKPVRDPDSGSWIRVRRPISPTAVLKFIVVADLLRRMHARNRNQAPPPMGEDENERGGGLSPLAAALLLGRRGNPAMALLLSKFMAPSNSAYVPPIRQHYTFERLNERYTKDSLALDKVLNINRKRANTPRKNMTQLSDLLLGSRSSLAPSSEKPYNETIIVMDLTGLDTSVSQMDMLRDEVTFLLTLHQKQQQQQDEQQANETAPLEVVILLESPGGSAADYSLASQQLMRLRSKGIQVTICVDKVAASGGYMMACTSSPGQLLAAPFAVLGSIGVIGQTFNIHKTLEGWGVRPLVFRGGPDKAPVGLIGEVTPEGIEKVQVMIDKTHRAFKRHVTDCRPVLASKIDEIATGEVFLGQDALEVGLVDRIVTSDEYIGERIAGGARVLKLVQLIRPRYPFQKPTTSSEMARVEGGAASSLLSGFRSFRSLVGKAKDALGSVAVDDSDGTVAMARAMGVTDSSYTLSPCN